MENSNSRSNSAPRKRNDQGRRGWSQREEHVLIAGLKEIVANGWKSENGFKVGYLQALEQHMVKELPSTNIKTMPHIKSKVHVWKKNYGSLQGMLSKGGIGLNDTDKMIEATDEAWDAYVKVDSNARLMRYKSWPFYNDWCEIFGKDRATGNEAKDFVEVVNEVLNAPTAGDTDILEGFHRLFDESDEEAETMSFCQGENSASVKKHKSKKRKSVDSHDPVYELLGSFCETTNVRLGEIAKRIGYEYDTSNAINEVFTAVSKIIGLNQREKLLASNMLVQNVEVMDLFFSLHEDDKAEFVGMKLTGYL